MVIALLISRFIVYASLLLILSTTIYLPLNTLVYTSSNGFLGYGVLRMVSEYFLDKKPYSYKLLGYNGELYAVYSSDAEIHVFHGDEHWVTRSLGAKYYFQVDRLLLIIGLYQGIDFTVFDLASSEFIISKSIEIPANLVLVKPISAYYSLSDETIDIYIYSRNLVGQDYTVIIEYSIANNTVYLVGLKDYLLYYGNIIPYTSPEDPVPVYKPYNTTISLTHSGGYTLIDIGGKTYYVQGRPYLEQPVTIASGYAIVVLTDNDLIRIIKHYNNTFVESTIPMYVGSYNLKNVFVASTSIAITYVYGDRALIRYYRLNDTVLVNETIIDDVEKLVMTYTCFDPDNLPDPIVYRGHYLYVYSSSSGYWRVYWDYLLELILDDDPVVYINNILYMGLVLENTSNYIFRILKYVKGAKLDDTPPKLIVYEPSPGNVYLDSVVINVSARELESSVYLIKAMIMELNGSTVYLFEKYGSRLYSLPQLTPGAYILYVEAWNIDGFSSNTTLLFYVVDRDITILKPKNYTFTRDKLYVEIISYGNYTVDVTINNTMNYTLALTSGLNNYVFNLSMISDGLLHILFYVRETQHYINLYVYKDTVPPVLNVYGLVDNMTVYSSLTFTVNVYDPHLDNTSIYLNNTLVKTLYDAGEHNVSLDLTDYPAGLYILSIIAFDKAGNKAFENYTLFLPEVGEPLIEVSPAPPNNTFVSGMLNYTVTCYNVSKLEIIVNGSIISVYPVNSSYCNLTISINTMNWGDSIYLVVFNATGFRGKWYALKYIWFVDNRGPFVNMTVPLIIIEPTGIWRWRNNSFVPVLEPNTLAPFMITYKGRHYFPLSIEVTDYWFVNATLYINGSLAEYCIVSGGKVVDVKPAIFTRSGTYYVYVGIDHEGYYVFELKAFDRVGHISTYIIGAWFDFSKPDLTILYPVNNTITRNLVLEFNVTDDVSWVFLLEFYIQKDEYVRPSLRDYIPFPYLYRGRVNETYRVNVPLKGEGKYYLSLLVFDSGLNYDIETIVFTIDRTPPEIKYNYSIIGNKLYLNISIVDNTGVNLTYISIDDVLVNVTSSTNISLIREYNPGIHVINVTSIDLADNTKTVLFNVTIKIPGTITPPKTSTKPRSETSTTTGPVEGETDFTNYLIVLAMIIVAVVFTIIIYRKKRR